MKKELMQEMRRAKNEIVKLQDAFRKRYEKLLPEFYSIIVDDERVRLQGDTTKTDKELEKEGYLFSFQDEDTRYFRRKDKDFTITLAKPLSFHQKLDAQRENALYYKETYLVRVDFGVYELREKESDKVLIREEISREECINEEEVKATLCEMYEEKISDD